MGEHKCQRLKPDVDKLAELALPVVAVELGQLLSEPALKLRARLVLCCVPCEYESIFGFLGGGGVDPDVLGDQTILSLVPVWI